MAAIGKEVSHVQSLCFTIGEFSTSAPNLVRVMDVVGDRIIPPDIDPSKVKRFDNRETLFFREALRDTQTVGFLAVYDWRTYESISDPTNDYTDVQILNDLIPIEVIDVKSAKNPDELAEKLQSGVSATPMAESRHILFTYESNKFSSCGILIPRGGMVRGDDGLLRLSENITVGKIYTIPESKIISIIIPTPFCGRQGFPTKIRLCKIFDIGTEDETYCLRSPIELVRSIILSKASWPRYSKLIGGTHAQHDALKTFIASIGEDSLIQEIAKRASVSDKAAAQFLDKFREAGAEMLHAADFDKETLEDIINSNEQLRAECVEYGKSQWLEKNQVVIKEAEERAAASKEEADKLEAQKNALEEQTKTLQGKFQKISSEVKEKESLVKNVPVLLRKQLTAGSADFYKMMTSRMLCGTGHISGAIRQSEEIQCERVDGGTYSEALDCLEKNLIAIGIPEHPYLRYYAALLLGAYYRKETCLIYGRTASAIVKAVCAAVSGRSQDILECSGEWDYPLWETALDGDGGALEVRGALLYGWVDRILFDCTERKKPCFITEPDDGQVMRINDDERLNYPFPIIEAEGMWAIPDAMMKTAALEDGTPIVYVPQGDAQPQPKFDDLAFHRFSEFGLAIMKKDERDNSRIMDSLFCGDKIKMPKNSEGYCMSIPQKEEEKKKTPPPAPPKPEPSVTAPKKNPAERNPAFTTPPPKMIIPGGWNSPNGTGGLVAINKLHKR